MGPHKNSAMSELSGHAPKSGPQIKMEEVVTKSAPGEVQMRDEVVTKSVPGEVQMRDRSEVTAIIEFVIGGW